jgi:hypothetical protein
MLCAVAGLQVQQVTGPLRMMFEFSSQIVSDAASALALLGG